MKQLVSLSTFCGILFCLAATPSCAQTSPPSSKTFVGSTPCDSLSRSLLNIPPGTSCEWMKWKLEIAPHDAPTNALLTIRYGMTRQGSREFLNDPQVLEWKGKWDHTNRNIYTFKADGNPFSLSFEQVSNNVLHVLDKNNKLLPGNGAWSYSLNAINPESATSVSISNETMSLPANYRLTTVGVFDGRTPCDHALIAFHKINQGACQLSKWRLILHQDSITHQPTNYSLQMVFVGTGNNTYLASGKWTVHPGKKNGSDVIIYQLQLDSASPSSVLNLLKVDDKILFVLDQHNEVGVGNDYASYSLNRNK